MYRTTFRFALWSVRGGLPQVEHVHLQSKHIDRFRGKNNLIFRKHGNGRVVPTGTLVHHVPRTLQSTGISDKSPRLCQYVLCLCHFVNCCQNIYIDMIDLSLRLSVFYLPMMVK